MEKTSKTDAVSPRPPGASRISRVRRGATAAQLRDPGTRRRMVALLAVAGVLASCAAGMPASRTAGGPDAGPPRHATGRPILRILSYNVQNLFDDVDDGGEYPEYTSAGGWTRSDYYRRLERLDEAIRLASGARLPEIIVLSEVENAGIGETLAREFLRRYRWVVADPARGTRAAGIGAPDHQTGGSVGAPDHQTTGSVGAGAAESLPGTEVATTGVVVLSRWEPWAVHVHAAVAVDLVPGGDAARGVRVTWQSRALVEMVVDAGGAPLRLFAAHWKSQSGGERVTEAKRLVEARLFVAAAGSVPQMPGAVTSNSGGTGDDRRSDAPETEVLLVGDLNEDLDEYRQHGRSYETALMHVHDSEQLLDAGQTLSGLRYVYEDEADAGAVGTFLTGWPRAAGVPSGVPGSYAFRGEWERLDHVFLRLPSRFVVSLRPFVAPALLRDGVPARYDPRTGYGTSDHLPVGITVARRQLNEPLR